MCRCVLVKQGTLTARWADAQRPLTGRRGLSAWFAFRMSRLQILARRPAKKKALSYGCRSPGWIRIRGLTDTRHEFSTLGRRFQAVVHESKIVLRNKPQSPAVYELRIVIVQYITGTVLLETATCFLFNNVCTCVRLSPIVSLLFDICLHFPFQTP